MTGEPTARVAEDDDTGACRRDDALCAEGTCVDCDDLRRRVNAAAQHAAAALAARRDGLREVGECKAGAKRTR